VAKAQFMVPDVIAAFPPHLVLILLLVATYKGNKGGASFRKVHILIQIVRLPYAKVAQQYQPENQTPVPSIMSLSIRSFTISLKPGEPTFKWDPSRKWTTESVGDFIAIRDREFEKLGKELKGKFDRTEDKAAMKLKLDLASTQQDLAERIKKPC
jgi:hypothetical protein